MRPSSTIRVVAGFEALKGGLVLVVGLGLLALVHHDVQAFAEQLVRRSHLNPASRYPRIFLQAAAAATDARLWAIAAGAGAYAIVRFIEAYGLWRRRKWAEWFAVVSGGIYVPIELYELAYGITWPKLLALAVNLAIVISMARELRRRQKESRPFASGFEGTPRE